MYNVLCIVYVGFTQFFSNKKSNPLKYPSASVFSQGLRIFKDKYSHDGETFLFSYRVTVSQSGL